MIFIWFLCKLHCLIGVSDTCHTAHNAEDVVINSVDANLGGCGTGNGRGRKDKLEDSVINSGEIARPAGLVFLRAKGKGIKIDTTVRGSSMVLVRLNNIEV